ncbi:MAG: zinc-ribbon domain containing protein [Patescibacteria group bacterium]
MDKSCKNCRQNFEITSEDLNFYEKIGVSEPTLCPDCRYQRRLANRNEWNFYKRDCSLCGKSMVSLYNPTYPGPVYCQPCYWSDNWDTLDYGRDFDFNRPFFEQFKEHRFTVPRIALANSKSVNSEYTNQASENRNCYMLVAASWNEFCAYSNWMQHSRESIDCWNLEKCEMMYEALFCNDCYHCAFVDDCGSSHNIYFCDDVVGCSDCFGCVSIRKKSYCWFNEQLAKEEYEKRFKEVDWSWEGIRKNREKLYQLRLTKPVDHLHGDQVVNSTGDYIDHTKNTHVAFNCGKNENLKYAQDAWEAKDCMDLTETLSNTLEYELEGAGWSQGSMLSCKLWTGLDVLYSELTFHSEHIVGSVSLIKKKYCIFNKQYDKASFEELRMRLVAHMKKTGEWGEFFPAAISPFPYNDTVALDYFPMTKEQVLAKGWKWYTKPRNEYQIGGDVLQCTSAVGQNKEGCAGVGAFRLHPMEIEFYKKMSSGGGSASGGKLPTPELCFPCRLRARLARRNPRKLWTRQCMKCSAPIETSYAPDRPEIVYCESCYYREVA